MNRTNDTADPEPPSIPDQYRARDTDDGAVEIYDSENEEAWIRSDYTLEVARPN
ncbi:DUF7331 family protein [Haloarchaeobius sp. TZWWS8]|uniref:DUF7331 family protein n=1 Tax=Haloarchaeobius sp. TZWWS8 TaxID=3446121 RepID=UPI003EBCB3B1